VETRRTEHTPQRLDHPPGDDDHRDPRAVGATERRDRAGVQDAVTPGEGVVEVGRDDVDRAREILRELDFQSWRDALTT
jgi:hypothetical protein